MPRSFVSKTLSSSDGSSMAVSCTLAYQLEGTGDNDEQIHERMQQANRLVTQFIEEAHRDAGIVNSAPGPVLGEALKPANMASPAQLRYARQLAKQVPEFGSHRLDALSRLLFAKPLPELLDVECRRVIDTLKDFKAGRAKIPASLTGHRPEDSTGDGVI